MTLQYGYGYGAGYGGSTSIDVDFTGVEEWRENDDRPLPAGVYKVFIEKAEIRQARTSGNRYLSTQYKVMEGEHQNRCIFDTFVLWGPNSAIAKSRFMALRHACGLNKSVGGTLEELLHQQFLCSVKLRQKKDGQQGELENTVSGYKPVQTAAPMPQPPQAGPSLSPIGQPQAPQQTSPQAPVAQKQEAPAAGAEYPWS